MIDQLTAYIISIAPSLIAVISTVCMVVKILNSFKDLRNEVKNTTEMTMLKEQMQLIQQENYELKKQIKELIQKIDKVKLPDEPNDPVIPKK